MKVNNQLSLDQLLQVDSPHQLAKGALNIDFNTDCNTFITGKECTFYNAGLEIHEWGEQFTNLKISNASYHLYFGSKVIKIGDSKSSLLSKFVKAPAMEKLYTDNKENKTYIYLSWYVGGVTHTYIDFFFDTNTQKIVKYGLIDILN